MTTLHDAFTALHQGRHGDAERSFAALIDDAPVAARQGLAQVYCARSELDQAQTVLERAIEIQPSPVSIAMLADVLGQRGRRADAESLATNALSRFPESGYLRTVRGEQRIRRADWESGTQDMIEGMSNDQDGRGLAHLHRVLANLTEAVVAGKVGKDDAMRFVNKIDYKVANKNPGLANLLAHSRRAINGRFALDDPVPPVMPEPPHDGSGHAVPLPPPTPKAPAEPAKLPPQPATRSSRAPEGASSRASVEQIRRSHGQAPPLARMMGKERQQNETLQQLLEPIGLPTWPSDQRLPKLDTIAPVRPEILGFTPAQLRSSPLDMTTGSVDTEILLERCLQTFLRASQQGSARAPLFSPEVLTQVEIALWDGLLEKLQPIPSIYTSGQPDAPIPELALGMFLGETLVRVFDGTWTFERVATQSRVRVGTQIFDPFELARRWIAAEDKDSVYLESMMKMAERHASKIEAPLVRVDTSAGLADQALTMKLAELWTLYRSHPNEVLQSTVAASVRPLLVEEPAIAFAIGRRWAPPMAAGRDELGTVSGEVALGYLRATGEFLCLGSRKHFARFVGAMIGRLTQDVLPFVADLLDLLHIPALEIIREGAGRPEMTAMQGGGSLATFTARDGGTSRQWTLVHDPDGLVPWRLEI